MNPSTWVDGVVDLIWRIGGRLILLAGVVYFLFRARSIIVAIILAAVLSYAAVPLVDFLNRYRIRGVSRKFQRFLATLIVFVALGALVVIVVSAFFTPFTSELQGLAEKTDQYGEQLKDMAVSAQKWYVALPADVQKLLQTQDFRSVGQALTKYSHAIVTTTIDVVSHLWEIILIPVLAFYFTLDSRVIKRELMGLVPKRRRREALAIIYEINGIMRSYVIGQFILCVIAGLAVGGILHLLSMQYVLILGVFAGITRAVPVIGPMVSGAAIVILGLLKAPIVGIYLLASFAFLHFAESKFIMPKLIGRRMQLHPAVVIIVLLVGAEFFGILGMFMAAPVAAIIRVLVRFYLIGPKKFRVWGLSLRKRRLMTSEVTAQPEAEPLTMAGKSP